ncbi:MAG: glycosyltransferase family 2 protein [Aggregatilineales bacterium]
MQNGNQYTPSVSIIIPTYQGAAYLPATLTAIREQNYPATIEIVAVDSESTDNTPDILKQYGAVIHSIPHRQFTHGYARNVGVQLAHGEALVFLSQDALPVGTNWLRTLVAPLSDRTLGAVYARQVARPDATPPEEYFHLALYPPRSKRYHVTPGESISLSRIFFSNVCSAASRDICLMHPFDETLIMSEDQAFARDLLVAGYDTLYSADVHVLHSHHYSLGTMFRRNFDSACSLRGVSEDGALAVARQGFEYIAGETAFVLRKRRWRWLAAIPPYEAARIAGRIAGRYADRLPTRWRIRFSLHRGFWTHESSAPLPALPLSGEDALSLPEDTAATETSVRNPDNL